MKKIIAVTVVIVFGLLLFSGFEESEIKDSEKKESLKGKDEKYLAVLDICYSIQDLNILQHCKNESINEIIDVCSDKEHLELSVCSDPRLKTFYDDMDKRIKFLR